VRESSADIAALQELLPRRVPFRLGARLGPVPAYPRTAACERHAPPGEELAITVQGRAIPLDLGHEDGTGLRRALLDIYVPRYGPEWESFLDSGPVYARIDADRMFTFSMPSVESA
jgi:hypothetical protein